jgi:DNA-binding NtrC family response regulator
MRKLPGQENALAVLALIPNEADRDRLRDLFGRSNWLVSFTSSIAETVRSLTQSPMPVVLCDRDLPDGSWKDLLAAVHTLRRPPRVVVTSRSVDASLWAEALNLGCHDVLAQPFHAGELFPVLSFAWRSWPGEREDCEVFAHAAAI